MSDDQRLAAAVVAVAPDAATVIPELLERLAAARRRWPAVRHDAARLGRFIGHSLAKHGAGALPRLSLEGLVLASACAAGDEAAVAVLHERGAPVLARATRGLQAAQAQDVEQQVWQKLLVGAPPKIASYTGEVELDVWLRIVAGRQAIDALRRSGREVLADDEAPFDQVAASADPELQLLKARYRAEFREAFEQAFGELAADERNLLRYRLLDGLSTGEIGELHRVHKATAARWLLKVNAKLLAATRRALGERLRVDEAELDSILRLIRSDLQLRVTQMLRRD